MSLAKFDFKNGWEVRVHSCGDGTPLVTIDFFDGAMHHAESYVAKKNDQGVALERWHPDAHDNDS